MPFTQNGGLPQIKRRRYASFEFLKLGRLAVLVGDCITLSSDAKPCGSLSDLNLLALHVERRAKSFVAGQLSLYACATPHGSERV